MISPIKHYRSDGPGVGCFTFRYDGVMHTDMAQFLVRINTFWVGELKTHHSRSMTVISNHAAADLLEVLLQFFGNIKYVGDNTVAGDIEDGRLGVRIYGDNSWDVFHARHMLHRTGNTHRQI